MGEEAAQTLRRRKATADAAVKKEEEQEPLLAAESEKKTGPTNPDVKKEDSKEDVKVDDKKGDDKKEGDKKDEDDAPIEWKKTRIGVWDIYQERTYEVRDVFTIGRPLLKGYRMFREILPYAWRTIDTVAKAAPLQLFIYLMNVAVRSITPGLTLHYSGQLLYLVRCCFTARSKKL